MQRRVHSLVINFRQFIKYNVCGDLSLTALLIVLCCALFWPGSASGQNVQYTQNTVNTALRSNASVDPSNLGMSLQIPLRAYLGRGEASLPVSLYYSSKVWRIKYTDSINMYGGMYETVTQAKYAERSAAGWTSSLSVPIIEWPEANDVWNFNGKPICIPCNTTQTPYRVRRMYVHMPDGSSHELRKSDVAYNGPVDTTGVFYAVDGSRIRYDADTATLYLPDGTRYILGGSAAQFIDRNGNTQNFSYNPSTGQWEWVDTVGRRIGQPPLGSAGRADIEYRLPGINGSTAVYTFRWRSLKDPNTGESLITPGNPDQQLRNASDYYLSNPNSPPTNPAGGNYPQGPVASRLFNSTDSGDGTMEFVVSPNQLFNPVVLAEIVLPNGSSYKFTYNIYGEIDKIIYPTGGYERYVYGAITPLGYQSGPYGQVNRGVTERRVSASGNGTDEALWQYQVLTGTNNLYWVATTNPDLTRSERYLHNFIPAPTGNSNSIYVQFGYDDARNGMAYDERFFAPASQGGAMLRRKLTQWTMDSATYPSPFPITGSRNYTARRNQRVTKETEIILDTGGNALVKHTTYGYDGNHNPTNTNEYGFTTVDQYTAQNGAITSMPVGPLGRSLEMSFLDSSNQTYYNRNILGLPTSKILRDGAGRMMSYTQLRYDEYSLTPYGSVTNWNDPGTAVRGNLTTTSLWLDTAGTYLESHTYYDQCGNAVTTVDALGRQMTISYVDSFSDGVPRNTYAYATTATTPVPDPSGAYASNTPFVTTSKYDFSSGLVTSSTEANGRTTSYQYDIMNRESVVSKPDGGSITYTYGDTAGNIYTRAQSSLNASQTTDSYQYFDGMGRPSRVFNYDGLTATPWSVRDTMYDSMGRVVQGSNSYRVVAPGPTVSPYGNCTTYEYDALGRVKREIKPDGSYITAVHGASTTGLLGLTKRTTDQANKALYSVTDSFGRVAQVVEDPDGLNYSTLYTYDATDKLRKIEQGQQYRYFMYDSLARLIRVKNPEQDVNGGLNLYDPITGNSQWSIAYSYDAQGNLSSRTDARGVTATYSYDATNRNTIVSYSDGTSIERHYDGAANGRMRFWYDHKRAQNNTTIEHVAVDSYDALGRPLTQRRQFYQNGIWSAAYTVQRAYNYAGLVTTQTYPSGRTVTYTYDAAGRANEFRGNIGDGVQRIYSTGISYDEGNRLTRETFGTDTPLYHKLHYNVRGQLYDVRLSSVNDEWNWNRGAIVNYYSFQPVQHGGSGPDNNGNLLMQQYYVPNDDAISSYSFMQQNYGYDALNRLNWVGEYQNGTNHTGAQGQNLDRYGNRTPGGFFGAGINGRQFAVDTNTNRLGVPAGLPGVMQYDANGNLVNDTYSGFGSRVYDAENRMTSATNNSGQQSIYTYDADGRRSRRNSYAQETWQVYGLEGELLAEYAANASPSQPQKEYGYRGGQLLISASGQNCGVGYQGTKTWAATSPSLGHLTGHAEGSEWVVTAGADPAQAMSYGPYDSSFGQGHHTARFLLKVDNNNGSDVVAILDAVTGFGQNILVQRQIRRNEFTAPNQWQWFTLEFDNPCFGLLEARIWWQGNVNMRLSQVTVTAANTTGATVQWMVADQLGTPRMIADKSGSLAGITRHDYLPFGEEMYAGTGGRTTQQGYLGDGVRQQFTEKERDVETGLDYFINRYYSSTMGRFTTPDPLSLTSQRVTDPQRLNLYTYTRNNPVLLTDPNGLELYVNGTDAEVARLMSDLEQLTGLKFDRDKVTGRVTIAKNSPKPRNAEAYRIAGIIGDLSNRVEAFGWRGGNAETDKRGALFGITNTTGQALIDYDDVDKLNGKSKGTRPLDVAYHEIVEAYEYLTNKAAKDALAAGDKKRAYEIVHQVAIDAVNVYRMRVQGAPARGSVSTEEQVLDAAGNAVSPMGEIKYKVDYTTHYEYWTMDASSRFKLKSVEVVKKP